MEQRFWARLNIWKESSDDVLYALLKREKKFIITGNTKVNHRSRKIRENRQKE